MADFSGLGALDAAAWPVLDELTASTGENAASGIPTGGQAAAAMELDVGRLAADGDGPSSDWLEQLSQGVEEWDNAMKSKAKLKALDDAVAAWRMLYAPSEGALGDGGEEGEGSDAEVSDNQANAGYDE